MYRFWGKVRKGGNRGKLLGYPTANINLRKKIPPGIYLSKTKFQNKIFPSLTFIGKAETFGDKIYQGEVYILNFHRNLYGKFLSNYLIKKIRGNKKFDNAKNLISQMKKDEKTAKIYFSQLTKKGDNVKKRIT